jgi:hypothetical protein
VSATSPARVAPAAVEVDSDGRQRDPDAHVPDVADPNVGAPVGAPVATGPLGQ